MFMFITVQDNKFIYIYSIYIAHILVKKNCTKLIAA